ncbi:uncharacterized protein [Ptychodera flava]|uniref:uncharacterized protein n=1 Tax=Ptychodera flava TaxID=63121 RepID=UPI00396A9F5E
MWLYFKFDHFVFTYGAGLWYILWDEFFRISLVVPLFAITWMLGLQDIRKNLVAGYAFAMTCFCCGSVCYLGYFATNKVVLRSIRSRFYGEGNDDPDEISFSPYGSDDEDEYVSSSAMPRRRPNSGISTPSHATTSTVVMHDISMPGTSGQATDLAQKVTGDVASISICTDEPRLKLQDYDDDDD